MPSTPKLSVKVEVLLPILFLALHLIYYKAIAHLAMMRGINYHYLLDTPIDHLIPSWPIFIIAYTLIAVLNPAIAIYYLIKVKGYDQGLFRRLYISLWIMAGTAYSIWVLFPVKNTLRFAADQAIQDSLFGRITIVVHNAIPLWNSFPSFHVLLPWFLYKVMRFQAKQYAWAFWWMAVLIMIATVTIKVHYIADIVSAVIIAEIIYHGVYLQFEKRRTFENTSTSTFITVYSLLIVAMTIGALMMFKHQFISA